MFKFCKLVFFFLFKTHLKTHCDFLLEIIVLLWQRTYRQNLMMITEIKLATTTLYKDSSLRFTIKSKINFLGK